MEFEERSTNIERVAATVYRERRAGTLRISTLIELTSLLSSAGWQDEISQHLRAAETPKDQVHTDALADQVLAAINFEPDFTMAPELLQNLEDSLQLIQQDLQAAGIHRTLRLIIPEDTYPASAFVEIDGNYAGGDEGIRPSSGSDPMQASLAVAENTQSSLASIYGQLWPICPTHRLGAHPSITSDQPVWICNGGNGHIVSSVGGLKSDRQ